MSEFRDAAASLVCQGGHTVPAVATKLVDGGTGMNKLLKAAAGILAGAVLATGLSAAPADAALMRSYKRCVYHQYRYPFFPPWTYVDVRYGQRCPYLGNIGYSLGYTKNVRH